VHSHFMCLFRQVMLIAISNTIGLKRSYSVAPQSAQKLTSLGSQNQLMTKASMEAKARISPVLTRRCLSRLAGLSPELDIALISSADTIRYSLRRLLRRPRCYLDSSEYFPCFGAGSTGKTHK
jgi:hypothetical protein